MGDVFLTLIRQTVCSGVSACRPLRNYKEEEPCQMVVLRKNKIDPKLLTKVKPHHKINPPHGPPAIVFGLLYATSAQRLDAACST